MRDAGVRVPEFTTSRAEAQQWWQDNQRPIILGRTRHGMAARGIQVYEPGQALGEHELYVKHVPNQREYRVHVVRGEVIRVQGKYLDVPADHTNPYIKNHAQGFRFRTPERRLNRERTNQAINAVVALDLDFGAVDLCKGDDGQTYVFEVNTAPACSPMTLEAYVGAFTRILNERVAA